MRLEWQRLGEKLLLASASCGREAVLAVPFMKAQTLKRIVDRLSPSASLLCLTRWRLEELDMGVSDLECWDIVAARSNSRLLLRHNLHAKYFRFDETAYLGSANLTRAALGWSARPNAEALVEFEVGDGQLTTAFEKDLFDNAIDVTTDLVTEFRVMLADYAAARPAGELRAIPETTASDTEGVLAAALWFPQSRSPEYLFSVYQGDVDRVSKDGLLAAQEDLLGLDLPQGLPEPLFRRLVGSRLASTPVVVKLDRFLSIGRRFGEIRRWLAAQLGVTDATDDWQRLMRWLLFFLPERYKSSSPGYSEIFGRQSA